MLRKPLFLLALMLLSSRAFAQAPQTGDTAYVRCSTGQANVFLYQNLNNLEVLATPKCGDKVEILGHEDTLGGYLKVRTADGNEGYVPQAQITTTPPRGTRIAIVEEPPLPVHAGQGTNLPIPQPGGDPLDVPRAEIFGGYSYLSMDTGGASRTGFQGWHASGTYNLYRWFGVEADASGHYISACGSAGSTLSCGHVAFMGGPRVAYRTGNIVLFGHGLFGLGNLRASTLGLPASESKFAWAPGGGVEVVWTERISVRVGQVDYLMTHYTQAGATQQKNLRMSAGIVFRLGRVVTE